MQDSMDSALVSNKLRLFLLGLSLNSVFRLVACFFANHVVALISKWVYVPCGVSLRACVRTLGYHHDEYALYRQWSVRTVSYCNGSSPGLDHPSARERFLRKDCYLSPAVPLEAVQFSLLPILELQSRPGLLGGKGSLYILWDASQAAFLLARCTPTSTCRVCR